jgi:steroid 5-alpha reductase family enzyme
LNSFELTLIILGTAILFSFIAGAITRNYSHVDRLWSILPGVYALVWMSDYYKSPRYLIAAIIVIAWSIRLTTNFALKGGYSFSFKKGFYGEDYRWEILRQKITNRFLFEIFNLFFISFYQLALVFAITLPLYYYGQVTGPISIYEIALFIIHALLLLTETIADYQQLKYYKMRSDKKYLSDKRVQLGFNTFGLWKYSRHPNYICEIGQWIVVYLYLQVSTGTFHLSALGSILLLLLFIGSTKMAENITTSKYPPYKMWKKATPPWIPFLGAPLRAKNRKAFIKENNLENF